MTFARCVLLALLATSVPGFVACSSDSGAAATAAPATGTGDAGACSATSECDTGGKTPAAGTICVKTMDAKLLDISGKPLAGVTTTCCGRDVCIYGSTDDAGATHIAVCKYMTDPAYKVLGRSQWISFAAPVPDQQVVTFAPFQLTPLPAAGVAFPTGGAAGDVTSGDVTLSIPAGAKLTFPIDITTPSDRQLRSAAIAMANAPPAVDAALHLEVLYGLAPLDTEVAPPAKLTVPNSAGWAAGAAVELFVHGMDINDKFAPYAGWKAAGTATVSADGKTVVTDDGAGNGLPVVTLIGLRKKG
jgi:hypothetical protein